jgi:hypothetical protein
MALGTIKARLQDDFIAISGVTRAYDDTPDVSPTAADCPAVIMQRRSPFVIPRGQAADSIQYTYQFDILFLLVPVGLETLDYWDSRIEGFPKLFVDKLCSDYAGAGAWESWNKDDGTASFTFGIVPYHGNQYFGFRWSLDIYESVTTTMNPGV